MQRKIAFFEVQDWEKEHLAGAFTGIEVAFSQETLSSAAIALAKGHEIVSVFTDSQLDRQMLSQLEGLKMIATRSTGFDHIDLEAAKEQGVTVCNVPTYGENTVAEHTFALLLALSRNIYKSIKSVKENGFNVEGLTGFDLQGKTIGIAGMGHIGQHVARIAKCFEMEVLAFDVHEDKKLAKKLGFSYVPLEDLLQRSDVITLHLPYNDDTRHMINSRNMHLLKKGAYFINTARGGIIETSALVKALDDDIIAGAGLDVLEEECYIKEERQVLSKDFSAKCDLKTLLQNHVLMERDNVIITPHNAFNSKEALERILQTTVENINAFIKGNPVNVV